MVFSDSYADGFILVAMGLIIVFLAMLSLTCLIGGNVLGFVVCAAFALLFATPVLKYYGY